MEKKKSSKFKILFFILVAVFAVGIIGIIIPFDFENYQYSVDRIVTRSSVYPDSHSVSFDIKLLNSGSTGVANLQVSFRYRFERQSKNVTVHSDIVSLKKGLNTISIEYIADDWGPTTFSDIESLRIQFANGNSVAIYQNPLFARQNLLFFSLAVIGFIAGFVSFILWKTSGRVFVNPVEESFGNTISNTMRTFEERIKEAFKPVTEENKAKQKEKLVCSYCKCSFDGEKYDKCPHCGAPPEHKD